MLKKLSLILVFVSFHILTFSQTQQERGFDISGRIVDATDSLPLPMVAVGIPGRNLWTATSVDGNFIIKNLPAGRYVLAVSCLGYTKMEYPFVVPGTTVINLRMSPESLALGEVVVTSKRGTGISTSTTIGRTAIEHLQPSDISELMQLLPGQVTVNSNLSSVSQLGIREVSGSLGPGLSRIASLGTAIRINGAPLSNAANLQTVSTIQDEVTSTNQLYRSTTMQGADMRQLSVDNIESVEVVRGIPGVEEGDALSGVVKVHLIKGRTPLTARVKIDPGTKQGYLGKGFNLREGKGTLNTNFDFAQNHSDIRAPYQSYNRLSGYVAYNNTFFRTTRPLLFTLSATYSDSRSLSRQDPDKIREERLSNVENNLLVIGSGRWSLNSPILTSLNLNVSANIQRQENYEKRYRSFGSVQTLPISFVTGEFEVPYLLPLYYSELTVKGRPYYFNASLSGVRTSQIGRHKNNVRVGIDYRLSGNNGEGSIYDNYQPPSGTGFRPRPFSDIPAMGNLAVYAANELTLVIGETKLDLQAGFRFTNIQPDGLFRSSEDITSLDPRINLKYQIIEKRQGLIGNLGFRMGFGMLSLTPTLAHLYPDKSYRDLPAFNYYDPPNSLAVLYTDVITDTRNYNLKAASSWKYEAGMNMTLAGIDMEITGYYENVTDGFAHQSMYQPLVTQRYQALTQGGLSPRFITGTGVVYDDPVTGEPVYVPTYPDTVFRSFYYPENTINQIKKGLEFELDFGKLESLHTGFYLNGAYMYSRTVSTKDYYSTESSVRDQIVGIYQAGQGGRINERIISHLRTVTQIRPLAMVVSLGVQTIWMERNRNIHEDANGNILVYTDIPTDDPYNDISQRKKYNPISVLHRDGTITPWIPEYVNIRPYADLIKTISSTYYFKPYTYSPVFQLNMRLTKELSKSASISFNVNNITNYRPLQKVKGQVDSYIRRNQPVYFSGELTIRI